MARLSKDDILRALGTSPETIERELINFADDARVLSSNHPRLIDEHPNEWVGIYGGRVAATAKDFPTLLARLAQKKIPARDAIVRFIDREEKTFLL